MHIVCHKDKLIHSVGIALRAVSIRTSLPILQCILLEANETLKITGNDLEMSVETMPIEVSIIEKGSLAIDAKMFNDIIRSLPENDIIIKTEGTNALIKSGKAEFKIVSMQVEDFPGLPDIEKLEAYTVSSAIFKNMIRQTIFSLSTSEEKPALTGGLIEIEEGDISLICVDNFRISLRKEKLISSASNILSIIPGKTLNEIWRILPNNGEVNIYFSEKHILFETEEGTITSRTIEGEFLRYKQVMEQEHKLRVTIPQKELLESLERSTLIYTDTKRTPVEITIEKNKFIVVSNAEIGNLYDEIDIEAEGAFPLKISFNPKFLIDAIKVMDTTNITLSFNTNLSPVIITDENFNYKYLILPLRAT